MKIAVASEGKSENSQISSRGGRASFYLIFQDGKLIEVWKNTFAIGGGGAGWSVAYSLAEKKIKKVIAGKFGGNMITALKEKGINIQEREGKVSDSLK